MSTQPQSAGTAGLAEWPAEDDRGEAMKEECEVTQVSLDNIAELASEHGRIRFIEHSTAWPDEQETIVLFEDGYQHRANGFAVGYPGKAPEGLYRLITGSLMGRTDITRGHIQERWRDGDETVRLILPQQGLGEALVTFPGVMDCIYDLEIW